MRTSSVADNLLKGAAAVLLLASFAAGVASVYAGADPPVNRSRDGLAVEGYDVVSYFVDGKAVAGREDFEATNHGTRYRFASAANRDLFLKNPDAYLPQYGGYCSYAVSRGYTAAIDPLAFTVVNGRLYLNYSLRVRETWEKDRDDYIRKADANWPEVQKKLK